MLVDSSVSHNLLKVLACQLKLIAGPGSVLVKAVNSKATAVAGVASTVHI